MGGTFPLIALLVVLTIGRHGVSAIDCFSTNCEFVVREECQTSEKVICNMEHQPKKKINLNASSFPRDVQKLKISNADVITFQSDAIASLMSLQIIEITNVTTLTLLPLSLARIGESRNMTVTFDKVKSLHISSQSFPNWGRGSRLIINHVDDCQMLQLSASSTQLRRLSFENIQSLAVRNSTFSGNSVIDNVVIMHSTSFSLYEGAFAENVTVGWLLIKSVKHLTVHSGALSRNAIINNVTLQRVRHLNIERNGIEADIGELRMENVSMETCGENTFGGKIHYLKMLSSHINRTSKHCISAFLGMKELTLENSRFDHIETSGIYGTVKHVHINESTIGTVERNGLQLNVTKLLIEKSSIDTASERAFEVFAEENIVMKNCTINALQKDAFMSLEVKQGSGSAHNRIQLANFRIKHPQRGSLHFDQNQRVIVNEVKTDIPCTCDIATALGMDMSSQHTFWINQPLCEIKGTRPTLGHYLQKVCQKSTTTPPPTTTINTHGGTMLPELRASSEIKEQTFGDSSDQVSTCHVHMWYGVAIGTAVCLCLGVIVFVGYRCLRHRIFAHKSRLSHTQETCGHQSPPSPSREYLRLPTEEGLTVSQRPNNGHIRPNSVSAPGEQNRHQNIDADSIDIANFETNNNISKL